MARADIATVRMEWQAAFVEVFADAHRWILSRELVTTDNV